MKTEATGVKVLTTKKDGSPQFYIRLFDRPDFIKDGSTKKLWVTICENRIYFSRERISQIICNVSNPCGSVIYDAHVTVQLDDKSNERCKLYIYDMDDDCYQKVKDYEGGYDKLLYSATRYCYYIDKEDKTDVPRGSRLINTYYKKIEELDKDKVQRVKTLSDEIVKGYKEAREKNVTTPVVGEVINDMFKHSEETEEKKEMIIVKPVQDKSFKTIMDRHLKNLDDMSSKLLHELIDNPAEVPSQEGEYNKCLKNAMDLRNMIRRMRNEGNDT